MNPVSVIPQGTKVLVIDDSKVMQGFIAASLQKAGADVATADHPVDAERVRHQWCPDVLVLDIDMPHLDGLTYLQQLMRSSTPVPVVMCSSLTQKGRALAVQALKHGAAAVVAKSGSLGEVRAGAAMVHDLVAAVTEAMAQKRVVSHWPMGTPAASNPPHTSTVHTGGVEQRVVAMGLSTGGVAALSTVLRHLSVPTPGWVVVQHMPSGFIQGLAAQLQKELPHLEIKEATDGDAVLPNRVLMAPGGLHLVVRPGSTTRWMVSLSDAPAVNFHKPSVDVLFDSLAMTLNPMQPGQAMGLLMTGMGDDGAKGLHQLQQAGGVTAVQSESTCAVYGMPAAALKLCQHPVVDLQDVPFWVHAQMTLGTGVRSTLVPR